MKWDEQAEYKLKQLYEKYGTEGLDIIGTEMGTTKKSLISKLVRLKIYKPIEKSKSSKTTKKMIVQELVRITGYSLDGIEAAPKETLVNLLDIIKGRQDTQLELPL